MSSKVLFIVYSKYTMNHSLCRLLNFRAQDKASMQLSELEEEMDQRIQAAEHKTRKDVSFWDWTFIQQIFMEHFCGCCSWTFLSVTGCKHRRSRHPARGFLLVVAPVASFLYPAVRAHMASKLLRACGLCSHSIPVQELTGPHCALALEGNLLASLSQQPLHTLLVTVPLECYVLAH